VTSELPVVAIIVLNYQGAADTITCIASLKALDYPHTRLIVVDNASKDDSVEKIKVAFPQTASPEVELIEAPSNEGYSVGNNWGIQKALAQPDVDYIWLLNNDTTVPTDALSQLVQRAQEYPQSLIGPVVVYPDGRFQRVGNRINPWRGALVSYSEEQVRDRMAVESLSGCSMLVPRQVFETVGLLSPDYFLYFEDNDFCLRARQFGFSCVVAAQAKVYHQEGATTGRQRPLVTYYYQRNRLYLAQQFFSPLQRILVQAYTLVRLFRSTIKLWLKPSPEAKIHHQAFQWAVDDFYAGVTGKCPHQIQ
jgi:GT2 family glycosyltransferase